jgi:hypothetical protein
LQFHQLPRRLLLRKEQCWKRKRQVSANPEGGLQNMYQHRRLLCDSYAVKRCYRLHHKPSAQGGTPIAQNCFIYAQMTLFRSTAEFDGIV